MYSFSPLLLWYALFESLSFFLFQLYMPRFNSLYRQMLASQ